MFELLRQYVEKMNMLVERVAKDRDKKLLLELCKDIESSIASLKDAIRELEALLCKIDMFLEENENEW